MEAKEEALVGEEESEEEPFSWLVMRTRGSKEEFDWARGSKEEFDWGKLPILLIPASISKDSTILNRRRQGLEET